MEVNYYKKRLIPIPFTDRSYEIKPDEALKDLNHQEGDRLSVQPHDSKVRLPMPTREDYDEVQALYDNQVQGNDLAQSLVKLGQAGVKFFGKVGEEEAVAEIGLYGAYNGATGDLAISDLQAQSQGQTLHLNNSGMLLAWAKLPQPDLKSFDGSRVSFKQDGQSVHPFQGSLSILSQQGVEVNTPDSPIRFKTSKPEDLHELEAFYARSSTGQVADPDLVDRLGRLAKKGARFYGRYQGRLQEVGRFGAYNGLTHEHQIDRVTTDYKGRQIPLDDPRMLDFLLEDHPGIEADVNLFGADKTRLHTYEGALRLHHGEEVNFQPKDSDVTYPLDDRPLVESLYGDKKGDELVEELKKFRKLHGAPVNDKEKIGLYGAYLALNDKQPFTAKVGGADLQVDSLKTLKAVNDFYADHQHPIHALVKSKFELFNDRGEAVHPFQASRLKSFSYGEKGVAWRPAGEEAPKEAEAFRELLREMKSDVPATQYAFDHREEKFDLKQALQLVDSRPEGLDARKLTAFALQRSPHYLAQTLKKECAEEEIPLPQVHSHMNGSKKPEQSLAELEPKMSFNEFREAALSYLKERPELKELLSERLPGGNDTQRTILRNLLAHKEVKVALSECINEWQDDHNELKAGLPLIRRYLEGAPAGSPGAFAFQATYKGSDHRLRQWASIAATLKVGLTASENDTVSQLLKVCLNEVEDRQDQYRLVEGVYPIFKEEFPRHAGRFELADEVLTKMTTSDARGVARIHILESLGSSQSQFGLGLVDKLTEVSGRDATEIARGILEAVHPDRAEWAEKTFKNRNGWFFSDMTHTAYLHRELLENGNLWDTVAKVSERIEAGDSKKRDSDQKTLFKYALPALELDADTFKANQLTQGVVWRGGEYRLRKNEAIQGMFKAMVRHREARSGIQFMQFGREALSQAEDARDVLTIGHAFLDGMVWMPETGAWANLTRYLAKNLDDGPEAELLKAAFSQPLPQKKEDFYGLLGSLVESVEQPNSRLEVARRALHFLEINAEGEPKELAQRTLGYLDDRDSKRDDKIHEAMATFAVLSEQFAPERVTGDIKMGDEYIEFGDILVPIND